MDVHSVRMTVKGNRKRKKREELTTKSAFPAATSSTSAFSKKSKHMNRSITSPSPSRTSTSPSPSTAKRKELQSFRQQLSIFSGRQQLLNEIAAHPAAVVLGETGSGKTTQIPQYLLEQWEEEERKEKDPKALRRMQQRRMCITQPRRMACITVAQRVADERETDLGTEVGYRVRFEDVTSRQTRIKFLTDGMLMREALLDPFLKRYSIVILDEAHERTVSTDILFGVVKLLQQKRSDLKVIIMSATLDAELFANFFSAQVLYIRGRQFAVDVLYAKESQADYVEAAVVTTMQIHLTTDVETEDGSDESSAQQSKGDILVFLTGSEEIEACTALLRKKSESLPDWAGKLHVCPLYAALPRDEQLKAFEAAPISTITTTEGHRNVRPRKVVLSTNIAETSVTISGIRYVVDCGLEKVRAHNSKIQLDALVVMPISKASARQRAGRAGREAPGQCYRLYTQSNFDELPDASLPEIARSPLDQSVLLLKCMNIPNILEFPLPTPPSQTALKCAIASLLSLGALDNRGNVTSLGKRMAELPVTPTFSRAILAAAEADKQNSSRCGRVLSAVLIIVALLASDNVFVNPREKQNDATRAKAAVAHSSGDHLTLLTVFLAFLSRPKKERASYCWDNFLNYRTLRKAVEIYIQLSEYTLQGLRRAFTEGKDHKLYIAQLKDALSVQHLRHWNGLSETMLNEEEEQHVLRSFLAAFFTHSAELQSDGTYLTLTHRKEVHVHPTSVLFHNRRRAPFVMYNELVLTTKEYMRDLSIIDGGWLAELAPKHFARSGASATTAVL